MKSTNFSKSILLFLYYLLISTCNCTSPIEKVKVVIVGAGPAGIAASTKLLENNFTDFKVLEAEPRIGGRIKSVKFGNAYVDLGAEYCHGEKGNLVFSMVNDLDLLEDVLENDYLRVFYSNGSKLNEPVTKELNEVLTEDVYEENLSKNGRQNVSVGEGFLNYYNSTILKKYQSDDETLKILREFIRVAEKAKLGLEGAFSWWETSVQSHFVEAEGSQNLVWKRGTGYKIILDILMKSYPDPTKKLPIDDKIRLGTKVTEIDWSGEEAVMVTTESGEIYQADNVIFTPSIGVLKTQKTLFKPSLPQRKMDALETLGFEAVMKIILQFDSNWSGNDKSFVFLWSEEELAGINPEHKWITEIIGIFATPNNPTVRIMWVTGTSVPEIEKMSEEVTKEGCAILLNKFLGKEYKVGQIVNILRSNWWNNPNFHGVYSFDKVGTFNPDINYHQILSEPLKSPGDDFLLFAGEATNPIHYSTVHGAIETGHREANRILDKLGNNL